jgi:hypothetical protein
MAPLSLEKKLDGRVFLSLLTSGTNLMMVQRPSQTSNQEAVTVLKMVEVACALSAVVFIFSPCAVH